MTSAFLAFCIGVACFGVNASAASAKPEANDEPRHLICASLSSEALNYYKGAYTYDRISKLNGASDVSTSYNAMRNNELLAKLHELMTVTQSFNSSYSGYKSGSLAYYWSSTDALKASDTYVMFYSDVLANESTVMNREHIWPKSRASYYQTGGGSDLHHLRPSVASVNSAKSDHAFGDIFGTYRDGYSEGDLNGNLVYYVNSQEDLFECKDDVKGDVARILLYVYCRWEQPNLYTDMTENLPAPDEDDSLNTGKKVIESLDTLLNWCETDPVDTWEMKRNDLTQAVQGNRNVFIDYPELAWKIFNRKLPKGMSTPSCRGCVHEYHEALRTDAGCTKDGYYTLHCDKCGNELTKRLARTGHSDNDDDEVCDNCGIELTIRAQMQPSDYPHDGDHALLYHPSTKTTLSLQPDLKNCLKSTPANVKNGLLNPTPEAAVFTVKKADENSIYLKNNGKYLTAGETGNTLFFTDNPSDNGKWIITPASDGMIYIDSANAKCYGKTQRLEIYAGSAKTFSEGTTAAFKFKLFTVKNHLYDSGEVSKEPTYFENGTVTYTCRLCGEKHDENKPRLRAALGDCFSDGRVDIRDATALQRHIASLHISGFSFEAADADGNGVINIDDVTEIQKYIANFPSNPKIGA